MKKNLVSVSQLVQDGFCAYFHSGIDISRNGNIVCSGYMHDNLFYLKPIISALQNVEQVDLFMASTLRTY